MREEPRFEKITFAPGKKFDVQFGQAVDNEERFANVCNWAKVELKTETWQWEQTGNICIEYEWDGKPSGIAATEADFWVHELCRDGQTLFYLMFPVPVLRQLCRDHWRRRRRGGDGGKSRVVLIPLKDFFRYVRAPGNGKADPG